MKLNMKMLESILNNAHIEREECNGGFLTYDISIFLHSIYLPLLHGFIISHAYISNHKEK